MCCHLKLVRKWPLHTCLCVSMCVGTCGVAACSMIFSRSVWSWSRTWSFASPNRSMRLGRTEREREEKETLKRPFKPVNWRNENQTCQHITVGLEVIKMWVSVWSLTLRLCVTNMFLVIKLFYLHFLNMLQISLWICPCAFRHPLKHSQNRSSNL